MRFEIRISFRYEYINKRSIDEILKKKKRGRQEQAENVSVSVDATR